MSKTLEIHSCGAHFYFIDGIKLVETRISAPHPSAHLLTLPVPIHCLSVTTLNMLSSTCNFFPLYQASFSSILEDIV